MRTTACIIFSCLLLVLWPAQGHTQSRPVQAGLLYPDALHDPEQNIRRFLGAREQLELWFTLLNPSETDVSVDQETLLANVRVQVRVDRGLLPVRVEWSDSIRVAQVTRTRAEMERTFILEPSQSVVWVMRLRRTDGLPFTGTFIVETSVGDFATTRLIDGRPSRSANSFAVSSRFEVVMSASPSELAKFHRLRALRASERGDHEQELAWLLQAVTADPSDHFNRFGLATSYLMNTVSKKQAKSFRHFRSRDIADQRMRSHGASHRRTLDWATNRPRLTGCAVLDWMPTG